MSSNEKASCRPQWGLTEVYDPGFNDEPKHAATPSSSDHDWAAYSNVISVNESSRARRFLLQLIILILCAAYVAYQLSCIPRDSYYYRPFNAFDIDLWIRDEERTAIHAILKNIGPPAGALDGIVVASPSTGGEAAEPDYYYTWTRDAALTISSLLPLFIPEPYLHPWQVDSLTWASRSRSNHSHPLLEGLIRSYVTGQAAIQAISNPSGTLWTGGLAEPKFTVSGQPFTGSWGRPQRDGPALRALALIPYAHWLLDRGYPADIEYVRSHLYDPTSLRLAGSVIKNDLEEVANAWWFSSFDLWEEIRGLHLWDDAVSRRALQAGVGLAARLHDHKAADFYAFQAREITTRLGRYAAATTVNSTATWQATIPTPSGRTGLDVGTLLTVIHAGGHSASHLNGQSPPLSLPPSVELGATEPTTLATLRAYVLSFAGLYRVNRDKPSWADGWLVGRYATDVYDGLGFSGGNPWYIATFSVAHVLYMAQAGFARAGHIPVAAIPAFWADIGIGPHNAPSLAAGDPRFESALQRMGEVADAFVGRAARTVRGGRMSEQICRKTSRQRGARELTWSYASFLDMKRARDAAKVAVASATGNL